MVYSFHQETQRFAVGTVETVIIIYDLRTATKVHGRRGGRGGQGAEGDDDSMGWKTS